MSTPDVQQEQRPIYLVLGLIAMWMIGMKNAALGWAVIDLARDPLAGTSQLSASPAQRAVEEAFASGVAAMAEISIPLGLAELMLGSLLVVVAVKALFGRRASPSFAVQVIIANAALLSIAYALREPIRGRLADAAAVNVALQRPPGVSEETFIRRLRAQTWWSFRIGLASQLVVLGLCALAVTRPAARELLTRPESQPEEEN